MKVYTEGRKITVMWIGERFQQMARGGENHGADGIVRGSPTAPKRFALRLAFGGAE